MTGVTVTTDGSDRAREFASSFEKRLRPDDREGVAFEISETQPHYGAAEVIVTIVASTAAKAILKTIISELERYMTERLSEPIDVQIVVRDAPGRVDRFPIRLGTIAAEMLKGVFAKLRQAVDQL